MRDRVQPGAEVGWGPKPGLSSWRLILRGYRKSYWKTVLAIAMGMSVCGLLAGVWAARGEISTMGYTVTRFQHPVLFWTCEAVLAESAFHLKSANTVLAMVREGLVQVAFDCREHWPQLEALALRYADRNPDLADLCLIRLSEVHPRLSVITVDRDDFKIYRRNKRETIPLICPPER